ncbi:MAG: iron-containing alcohol dehydrogenase family protein [Halobacteriales archaeon]|nr:iron-containing alcohol dehydrogenase family protein [Halobacteriales archaeon]
MLPITDTFTHDYRGGQIVYGRGATGRLQALLEDRGLDRSLIVCGASVGSNADLMEPIRDGLGDGLVGVFDETTPAKSAETVFQGIDRIRASNPDVLVGVGGGSSLDIARQMSVFAADGRSLGDLREQAQAGTIDPPTETGALPVVVIPTTFAGADISSGGSIEVFSAAASPTDGPIRVGGNTMPVAMVYDPDLFETTPRAALRGSAMNGYDKGLETIYARDASPISDAMAVHGLRLLHDGLPRLGDPAAMERAVVGTILVQLHRSTAIIHAVGHGFSYRYDVQQGDVHAVVAPHVLRYILGRVDARRALLATALDVDRSGSADETAESIVDAVTALRDKLGCPTRLRDLESTRESDLPAIARFILEDPTIDRSPAALDPTVEAVEGILRAAW